jgi:hypothetical protein
MKPRKNQWLYKDFVLRKGSNVSALIAYGIGMASHRCAIGQLAQAQGQAST